MLIFPDDQRRGDAERAGPVRVEVPPRYVCIYKTYIYIYIYTYMYIYIYMYIHLCTYIHLRLRMCCIHTSLYEPVSTSTNESYFIDGYLRRAAAEPLRRAADLFCCCCLSRRDVNLLHFLLLLTRLVAQGEHRYSSQC